MLLERTVEKIRSRIREEHRAEVEPVSTVERRLRLVLPADLVSWCLGEGYAEIRKLAPLKGFRPGKAPMSMVRRVFRDTVAADVGETLVKETVSEAVRKNRIRILSIPRIEAAELAEGEEFAFTATFEVIPEVEPKDYKGIPVSREAVRVGDEEVEAAVARLRESMGGYHPVEGQGAGEGHLVEATVDATAAGEALESGKTVSVVLGGGFPYGKEFEDRLAGSSPGDAREFEVAFPADFGDPRLAGRTVAFRAKVEAVREKRLPELDDEFAKGFPEVSGLADLREKLRQRLQKEGEERSRLAAAEELRRALLERNPFAVPSTLVDRQIAAMIEDTANRLASQGVDLKKVHMDFDKMKERFAPNAEQSVRFSLLLAAVAEAEGLDVSHGEVKAEVETIAKAANLEAAKLWELYERDEDRYESLRNRLLERKTVDFLLSHAKTTEVKPG